jgi:hypothetical protein
MKEQVDKWTNEQDNKGLKWKINAGIACSDRANEVEPRPNEDRAVTLALSKSRRDDTLLTVCFSLREKPRPNEDDMLGGVRSVYPIRKSRRDDMSVENSTLSIKKSRRDDMSVEGNSTFAIKKSRRDDTLLTVCFSLREKPRPNEDDMLDGVRSVYPIRKSRRDDMSVENSTLSIKKSRRDDMSVEGNSTFAIKKSRRDDTLLTVCFSLRYRRDDMSGMECRDGARTVSSSAKKRINDVFDYVRGDGARTVSTTANNPPVRTRFYLVRIILAGSTCAVKRIKKITNISSIG